MPPRKKSSRRRRKGRKQFKWTRKNINIKPDVHCGVINAHGFPCTRVVTCHLHTIKEKRLVPKRSDDITNVIKKYKLKIAEARASRLKGATYDPNKHCGVKNSDGYPCVKVINCNIHTTKQKRAVEGRTKSFAQLIKNYKAALAKKLAALKGQHTKRIYNPDKHCGVANCYGIPCLRVVTCDLHKIHQKREVSGRSQNIDTLIKKYILTRPKRNKRNSIAPPNADLELGPPITIPEANELYQLPLHQQKTIPSILKRKTNINAVVPGTKNLRKPQKRCYPPAKNSKRYLVKSVKISKSDRILSNCQRLPISEIIQNQNTSFVEQATDLQLPSTSTTDESVILLESNLQKLYFVKTGQEVTNENLEGILFQVLPVSQIYKEDLEDELVIKLLHLPKDIFSTAHTNPFKAKETPFEVYQNVINKASSIFIIDLEKDQTTISFKSIQTRDENLKNTQRWLCVSADLKIINKLPLKIYVKINECLPKIKLIAQGVTSIDENVSRQAHQYVAYVLQSVGQNGKQIVLCNTQEKTDWISFFNEEVLSAGYITGFYDDLEEHQQQQSIFGINTNQDREDRPVTVVTDLEPTESLDSYPDFSELIGNNDLNENGEDSLLTDSPFGYINIYEDSSDFLYNIELNQDMENISTSEANSSEVNYSIDDFPEIVNSDSSVVDANPGSSVSTEINDDPPMQLIILDSNVTEPVPINNHTAEFQNPNVDIKVPSASTEDVDGTVTDDTIFLKWDPAVTAMLEDLIADLAKHTGQ